MNYELAEQLLDAGFPQRGYNDTGSYFICKLKGHQWSYPDFQCVHRKFAYIPTLSELIETCRLNDFTLEVHNTVDWFAKGYYITPQDKEINITEIGNTPEEAVAKLWLKLHEKS